MNWTASNTAFVMVASQQAVFALAWVVGAAVLPDSRRACLHWSAHAGLSALASLLWLVAPRPGGDLVLAAGNVLIVASMILLHRGVQIFLGRPPGLRLHLLLFGTAAAVSAVGLDPAFGTLRVAATSAILALLPVAIATDLFRLTRERIAARWRLLLVAPLLLTSAVFGARTLRAVFGERQFVASLAADNAYTTITGIVYLIVALIFQLTLVALVVGRYLGELQRASRHDALTGLANRRSIEEAVADEAGRARRLGSRFAVLMIDADHFKEINDGEGHAAGDRALQHLATVLASQLRGVDRVGRFGGEEFLMVLPATGRDEAAVLAERLVARVRALPPVWNDRPMPLTVSVGVAQWRGAADAPHLLLARADAALYRAKRAGRDRVEVESDADAGANVVALVRGPAA